MKDVDDLQHRLNQLQSSSQASGGRGDHIGAKSSTAKSMQERLQALNSGDGQRGGVKTQAEYNDRLAKLTAPTEHQVHRTEAVSLEEFGDRLDRLGPSAVPHLAYDVPQDFSETFQGLDDLLADVLDEDEAADGKNGNDQVTTTGKSRSFLNPNDLDFDQKLSALDAAAASEVEKIGGKSAGPISELVGPETGALEAFLRGGKGRSSGAAGAHGDDGFDGKGVLGDEEERLLQMVTDQVRLEGHGIITQQPPTKPSDEDHDGLWLPAAPTAKPVLNRPTGYGHGAAGATSHPIQDDDAAARLIAQQALDEARLGLTGQRRDGDGAATGGEKTEQVEETRGTKEKRGFDDGKGGGDETDLWCCLCSEDAVVRCRQCEEDNDADEAELFCAGCWKEVHRSDVGMKSHRPQAISRKGGGRRGGGALEGFKQGLRNWKR